MRYAVVTPRPPALSRSAMGGRRLRFPRGKSDSDGLDFDAVRVRNGQAFFGEALQVEGNALADELLSFVASGSRDGQAGKGRHIGAPVGPRAFVDDAPRGHCSTSFPSSLSMPGGGC